MNPSSVSPYVGPRTFSRAERHLFFGRERESRDLLSLVISERLVLFYAQSGAGKSSLINTCLIPDLEETKGFEVLPVGRVSGGNRADAPVDNLFVYNCLLSLHQAENVPSQLAHLHLAEFLNNLVVTPEGRTYYSSLKDGTALDDIVEFKPRALILDQFEEILTTNLHAWDQRAEFFTQVQEALAADPYLWVVLVMREDYVAGLTPYLHLLPDNLRARYYMQRMGYEAALVAVKEPAEQAGRPFAAGVAESLVDNLRQIRVPGQPDTQPGQFVEPVQLQVVCFQLWQNLQTRPPGPITLSDLEELGNTDLALVHHPGLNFG